MSKEQREELSKENVGDTRHKRKLRSPCLDSHYEAYILRSRWTVGSLYASNLYLGHVHMKYVQDIDRQQKTWLHFTERDQQKLAKRILELEALKRQYFEKSVRFDDKEFSAKKVGGAHKISRHISIESDKQQTYSYSKQNASLGRRHSHGQRLPDVFPPNVQHASAKAADVSPHPLKLLLPNQTQTEDKRKSGQRRLNSGYFHQSRTVAPIRREVLSGRFSSLSSRWRSRSSLSANTRLSSVSHEKGGKKLVPKWVPLAFRL